MARNELKALIFGDPTPLAAPTDNAAFLPADDAGAAHLAFEGVLKIEGVELISSDPRLLGDFVLAGRPERFPSVALAFTSLDNELVPLHRGLHRKPDPQSYWDIMVGTGQIWSEPGDGGKNRAVFPFQLSNEHENDSHHGLASFLYDEAGISQLVVQKVTETEPDHLPEGFDLWGRLVASRKGSDQGGAASAREARTRERDAALPIRSIEELRGAVGDALIDAVFEGTGSDTEIASGLVFDGTIYSTDVRARHGTFPYPRSMRFGLWSATKAAFGTTALLRLAQHLGPEIAETRIGDVVDVTASHDGWAGVTIRHCLMMASGIGTAGLVTEPLDVYADNLTEPDFASAAPEEVACYSAYQGWYAAGSRTEKLEQAFACPSYPWGPGEVARYRDQDLFMSGVAMDAVWKRHAGPDADLFAMVANEVYARIGIGGADMNRTKEPGGDIGVPLTAFGLYLGVEDVARLGRLLTDGGIHDGEQLLEPSLLASCIDGAADKGLKTGTFTAENREISYHLAYWQLPMTTRAGRDVTIPSMRGYGGQIIQPLWNGITCFRFGHDVPAKQDRYDSLKLPRIADAMRAL
ncbi:MAG: hypothetical protein P8Q36_07945 [Alphaproteobacteria bacterium]|jgi:hypothetical protein|nr:hypothetical protein [Rhodospirillaceae bacterium]MBT6205247.1 hypothetical protein [Rhodospirillaceae bacterium]MBT6509161.1 hypothetical protein [Rhodospirillaceae bacterium]MBT7646320.1 hypothetical protein [Rhodospirillaceae bacterium]MDG2480786.1 hypothetical protein [Alphaproteobacteria bacterium]